MSKVGLKGIIRVGSQVVDIVPTAVDRRVVAAPEINTCHQSGGAATPGINKPTSEQMHSGEKPKISSQ